MAARAAGRIWNILLVDAAAELLIQSWLTRCFSEPSLRQLCGQSQSSLGTKSMIFKHRKQTRKKASMHRFLMDTAQ
jgi:hypothetical protein